MQGSEKNIFPSGSSFYSTVINIMVFWTETFCGKVDYHRCFGGTCCADIQHLRVASLISSIQRRDPTGP